MKVAVVHDDFMRKGGAERVAKVIHDTFPDGPIYTLAFRPELTYPEISKKQIITSWFNKFSKNEKLMKYLFFPFGIFAMRSLKLKGFDLVIISSTYCAKYVRISKGTKVVTYCYTPFRLAWAPDSYQLYRNNFVLRNIVLKPIIKILKYVDFKAAQRTDYFIGMTKETSLRIKNAYKPKNQIHLIKPPVDLNNYKPSNIDKDYYLLVSRLEYYKKVDLVVEAFNQLGKELIIIGNGTLKKDLQKKANKNITFLSNLDNQELAKYYAECKCFIFPQHEDYGITPLEACASGRPVIAYSKGGVNDTMIPYRESMSNANTSTALFFEKQNVESLSNAVLTFEKLNFNKTFLVNHAKGFSEEIFKNELKEFIGSISNNK